METSGPQQNPGEDNASLSLLEQAITSKSSQDLEVKPIRPLSTAQILALKLPKPAWFYQNLLPQSSLVFFAGAPGSYKTFFALRVAIALSESLPLFNCTETLPSTSESLQTPIPPVSTLFIEEEMHINLIQERLNLLRSHKPPPSHSDPTLHFMLSNNVKLTNPDIMKQIKDFIIEHSIKLIVMDPFSSIVGTDDENDNSKISKVLDLLRRELVDAPNISATVILIHHPSKNAKGSANSLRGAGDIMGKADHVLVFERDPYEPQTSISCIKSRLDDVTTMPLYEIAFRKTADFETDNISLEVHLIGMHNSKGDKSKEATSQMSTDIKDALTTFPDGALQKELLDYMGVERTGTFTRSWKLLQEIGEVSKTEDGRRFKLSTVSVDSTSYM